MSVKIALNEIEAIVKRTIDNLLMFINQPGRAGAELRLACGDMRANINTYVRDGTFGPRLMICFRLSTEAGITIQWMDVVLKQLVAEKPSELAARFVVQGCILFALAQDGKVIRKTQYRSREEVEKELEHMKEWFDIVKDHAADEMDDLSYRALNNLAGAITRYLAEVARPLPRMLMYHLVPMPALAASQYIYGEGGRSEEIAAENRVIHPAFCRREIRGLSA
jgi:hypothetical protein